MWWEDKAGLVFKHFMFSRQCLGNEYISHTGLLKLAYTSPQHVRDIKEKRPYTVGRYAELYSHSFQKHKGDNIEHKSKQ